MIDPIDRNTALGITEECAKSLKWILSDEDLSESERKECEWKLSFVESIISDLKNVPSIAQRPEPCDDAVSRESILSILRENYRRLGLTDKAFMELCSLMKSEPPVTPKTEQCEDAISRRKAFEYFVSLWECIGTIMDREEWEDVCKTTANELPSVTPQRKTGRWIPHSEKCREYIGTVLVNVEYDYWFCDTCDYRVEKGQPMYNFCPNCGAKMEV